MIFNDTFTTVSSIPKDQDLPSFWNEIELETKSLQITLDPSVDTSLQDDWLTTEELKEKSREKLRSERIQMNFYTDPSPAPSYFLADATKKLEALNDKESSSPLIPLIEPTTTPNLPSTSPLRVISHSNKGQHPMRYINEVYMSLVSDTPTSSYKQALVYKAAILSDLGTGIMNCTDPRVYTINTRKGKDPDNL